MDKNAMQYFKNQYSIMVSPSTLLLNGNDTAMVLQDLRLCEYFAVIFECPVNLDDKNLYIRKVENITITKQAFASELENCFIVQRYYDIIGCVCRCCLCV